MASSALEVSGFQPPGADEPVPYVKVFWEGDETLKEVPFGPGYEDTYIIWNFNTLYHCKVDEDRTVLKWTKIGQHSPPLVHGKEYMIVKPKY